MNNMPYYEGLCGIRHYTLAKRAMAHAFGVAVDRVLASPVMAAWVVRVLIVPLSVSDKSRYLIA